MREGNFHEYVESLLCLIPWVFSLDHGNYARWLSVQYIRDMISLPEMHPSLYKDFCDGKFVARKTHRPFSVIALDQAHKQLNALIKGGGGAVGLTENPAALKRWMIAGPEICRMIGEFEIDDPTSPNLKHHEQLSST